METKKFFPRPSASCHINASFHAPVPEILKEARGFEEVDGVADYYYLWFIVVTVMLTPSASHPPHKRLSRPKNWHAANTGTQKSPPIFQAGEPANRCIVFGNAIQVLLLPSDPLASGQLSGGIFETYARRSTFR